MTRFVTFYDLAGREHRINPDLVTVIVPNPHGCTMKGVKGEVILHAPVTPDEAERMLRG
jgi:hypothetical protein